MKSPPPIDANSSWDVLTRRWLATGLQDEELYEWIRASVLQSTGGNAQIILGIIDHLRDEPVRRFSDYPDFEPGLSQNEILTLQVCFFFPGVMTAEVIQYATPEDAQELAEVTLDTARDFLVIAAPLDDLPLNAAICLLGCMGGQHLEAPQEAVALGKQSVRAYHALCRSNPGWNPFLARALKSLGTSLHAVERKHSALRCLKLALEIFEKAHNPPEHDHEEDIAGLLHNLSNLNFELGRMAQMVEASSQACKAFQTLASQQPEIYLPKLGHCLDNLAAGLRHLGQLADALEANRTALRLWRTLWAEYPDVYGPYLAEARLQMSYCLRELERPREARLAAFLALQFQLREKSPAGPTTLGLTYDQHAACAALTDETDQAIKSFKNALQHLNKAPLALAECQDRLSKVLSHAGRAEDALHYAKCAVDGYDEFFRSHESHPDRASDLARVFTNLAARLMTMGHVHAAARTARLSVRIYRELAPGGDSPDLGNQVSALLNFSTYLSVLGHHKRAMPPILRALALLRKSTTDRNPQLAKLLTNLSLRYFELGDFSESIKAAEEAIGLYRHLIETHPRMFRLSLISALNNYALGCFQLQEETKAAETLVEALELLKGLNEDPTRILEDVITIRRNEALRRIRLGTPDDYLAAYELLKLALKDSDQLRARFRSDAQRKRIQAQNRELHVWQIGLCLGLAKLKSQKEFLRAAFDASESARARSLGDLLMETQIIPKDCDPQLIREFYRLRRQLGDLDRRTWQEADLEHATPTRHRLASPDSRLAPPPDLTEEQKEESLTKKATILRQELDQLVDRIKDQAPDWHYEEPIRPASLDLVQKALPEDSVLLQFTILKDRLVALAIPSDDPDLIPLEISGLTGTRLNELQADWQTHRSAFKRGQIDFQEFAKQTERILGSFSPFTSGEIGNYLCQIKVRIKRLVLCPSGPLHQFPLHACLLADQSTLADSFEVSYTPSASILTTIQQRLSFSPPHHQLVTNPTRNLPGSHLEHQILKREHTWHTTLNGPEASKAEVLSSLEKASYLLFSGHAQFVESSPSHSGLLLSDGTLTIQDLFEQQRLTHCQLAFLNGCESGFMKTDTTDDFVSLTSAFLYSGAKTVISTLWPIHDLSSCLFSIRFNELLLTGNMPAGRAFQEALQWLRGKSEDGLIDTAAVLTSIRYYSGNSASEPLIRAVTELLPKAPKGQPPFSSPAYWAAYTISGVLKE